MATVGRKGDAGESRHVRLFAPYSRSSADAAARESKPQRKSAFCHCKTSLGSNKEPAGGKRSAESFASCGCFHTSQAQLKGTEGETAKDSLHARCKRKDKCFRRNRTGECSVFQQDNKDDRPTLSAPRILSFIAEGMTFLHADKQAGLSALQRKRNSQQSEREMLRVLRSPSPAGDDGRRSSFVREAPAQLRTEPQRRCLELSSSQEKGTLL
ncbi:hypothetical protein TGDOM2_271410 [Toxoplasma gondii GAB2-2007-GAL-DOM2]|uniref:Uncharacterized protein n=6 Tax=Toxoplasma gondii TaxID=5811 RepID=S7V415_TOXGG|nr:hypothetical protein TGGT1_271410 [Toxoplasma gondii GT1]KAF4642186.1 hypothetical protein TGRH88_079990 [Toxoplasma gondii]KFG43439.1 hypothetical protein TGDOM2_271410 [Toxoplasma gondii GAB2-2007-GAL-DOM2]KFG54263.1 hypothetical protein TGFOU_271410 [Toxoplasma gondii FOU]PUA92210.1 hypothetical protein TGBR9_271410 [Toxoplasma gondii TgCATBr9]RQX75379.1 hypothetical protein TGCAST_271410 [Toxoplasma gondii CAST]